MTTNYYTVLGLPQNATSRQIRQRFLELARARHPDRFQGEEKAAAESEFQEVTLAFNVLSDPERRRQHDVSLLGPGSRQTDDNAAAKEYFRRGAIAYRDRSFGDAVENFERAVKEDETFAKAWYYLADSARHIARLRGRAVTAALRACDIEKMDAEFLKLAGHLLQREGDTARAEQYFQRALDWGGEDEEIQAALDELSSPGKKGKTGFFG